MNIQVHDSLANNPVAPAKGRLLSVVRPSRSTNLIVCFNGYGNKAYSKPGVPFDTNLDGYTVIPQYHAHVIWFVEEKTSWYLEHEDEILERLIKYVVENGITHVKLLGCSAGAYASLRFGILLDKRLAMIGNNAMLVSFAVNPQTGFRPELLAKVKQSMAAHNWNPNAYGTDPVLLPQAYYDAYAHRKIDISQLLALHRPRNLAAVVMHDAGNPIEMVFSGDIFTANYVLNFPQRFGLDHGSGCARLWREFLWEPFDKVAPFGKAMSSEAMRLL
jgi:hypothetical protein